jgi:hypothetical protein
MAKFALPEPAYVNDEGLASTMAAHGLTREQAERYLRAEWAEWHRARDAWREEQRVAKQRVVVGRWRERVARLPAGLDAREGHDLLGSRADGRVDVDLTALLELLA